MGSKLGVEKIAAARLGLSLEDYRSKRAAGFKWCTGCKDWVVITEFTRDSSRGDGLGAGCWNCQRKLIHRPGPSIRERRIMRIRGQEWCRDCKSWFPINEINNGKCQPCTNKAARTRYAQDKQYRQRVQQYIYSRKHSVEPISAEIRNELTEQFDDKCAYCGAPATTWDHIIPISQGGGSNRGNIIPACISCNSSKRAQDVFDWLEATNRRIDDNVIDWLVKAIYIL